MVHDHYITAAVSGIYHRAERQPDTEYVVGTFVDTGVVMQLMNLNNQVVYGRRGTGKTHLLKVLGNSLGGDPGNAVCSLDLRTIGSTLQFSDEAVPVKARALSLFRDVLAEVHRVLLRHLSRAEPGPSAAVLEALDELGRVAVEPVTSYVESARTTRRLKRRTGGRSAEGKLAWPASLGFAGKSETGRHAERETGRSFAVRQEDKIVFPHLNASLSGVLEGTGTRLYLLLDEWSSLPKEVQPYLAEFFKRSLLTLPTVAVKIASLEYRSQFGVRRPGGEIVGFEMGSDVSAALDLDDYYVYDRYPDGVAAIFADVLYRHIAAELPPGYLEDNYRSTAGGDLPLLLFTDRDAFHHLVRASEGVARDLIVVFTMAYMDARKRSAVRIDRPTVSRAARQWYDQDKSQNLDDELQAALERIIDEVVGTRRARSFLLPRELERSPVIQRLFDARVLHLMQRGFVLPGRPGVRYNVYTLDYGIYVDVLPGCQACLAGEAACADPLAAWAPPGAAGGEPGGLVLPERVLR